MYKVQIGLEIHVQLLSDRKIFCPCQTNFGAAPNSNSCPVCRGEDRKALQFNKDALAVGLRIARALHCQIPARSWFNRKHYQSADMPKGYQITQTDEPIGRNGFFDLPLFDAKSKVLHEKRIRIRQCHLEEDAAKTGDGAQAPELDFNRSGIGLVEIVSEPDFATASEAEIFIRELRRLLRWIGASDGNMEEGSIRCDANISLSVLNGGAIIDGGAPSIVELKNLNSPRFVRLALEHEIDRQGKLLLDGKRIVSQTRQWNDSAKQTEATRIKNADYRYSRENTIEPFAIDGDLLNEVDSSLPELPQDAVKRLCRECELNYEQAHILCEEKASVHWFEQALQAGIEGKIEKKALASAIANWMLGDIKSLINKGLAPNIQSLPLSPKKLAEIIALTADGSISSKTAKKVLELAIKTGQEPGQIIAERALYQIRSVPQLLEHIDACMAAETKALQGLFKEDGRDRQQKKEKLLRFFAGKVMAKTAGLADPQLLEELIAQALNQLDAKNASKEA